jgi:predicted enzyme related to lactoylglutathione lyase
MRSGQVSTIIAAIMAAAALAAPMEGMAMEKATGVGGVFFRSKDPAALAKWYHDNLGVDAGQKPWNTEAGMTVFAPFKEDTDYFGRREQQWMINFRVRDMDAMIAQLKAAGIEVETRPEWDSVEYGRFAHLKDPEGNPIELWEPPKKAGAQ